MFLQHITDNMKFNHLILVLEKVEGKLHWKELFAQKGASEHGQYNVATGEFTAGEYDYTTGKFTAASPQSGASSTPVSK